MSRIVVEPTRCGDARYSCVVLVGEGNGSRAAGVAVGSSRSTRERIRVSQTVSRRESTHVARRSGEVLDRRRTTLRNWEEEYGVALDKNK